MLIAGGASTGFTPTAHAALFTVTAASRPGAPTALSVTVSGRTAHVAFTPPTSDGGAPVTGYTATCPSGTGGTTRTGSGTVSPVTVPALTAGATYTCVVHATNIAGDGPDSTASPPFTVPTVPGAPTAVAVKVAGGTARVSFTPPSSDGGSPILIYRATCASSDGGTTVSGIGAGSPVTVDRLTGTRTYTCTVRAVNQVGAGTPSTPSTAHTLPDGFPGAPTDVTAAAVRRTVTVTFSPPASDGGNTISAYTVSCTRTTDGTVRSAAAPSSPAVLASVKPGAYGCHVVAVNSTGAGPTSKPPALITVP